MSVPSPVRISEDGIDYPTTDGKPMAETDTHRDNMTDLIAMLKARFESQRNIYISGNMLLFYERGNQRKHVSPDVFVVQGVANHIRDHYLLWKENKGPEFVIEVTSKSTRKEDLTKKFDLYRDILRVSEYFLFDPFEEYLSPSLQGYRRVGKQYRPIREVAGRMPSKRVGLHLERDGSALRLYDPAAERWLPTPGEIREELQTTKAEVEKLRRELDALRRSQ